MKAEYNTKLDKNVEAFIQLRIEGKSFDEIATELKTTKQTLIGRYKHHCNTSFFVLTHQIVALLFVVSFCQFLPYSKGLYRVFC